MIFLHVLHFSKVHLGICYEETDARKLLTILCFAINT
jgi:hypothetical protein